MSEPMTDADLAVIERQIAGWNALRPGSRSPMLWSNAAVGPLLARIRASEAERDAERSRADAAEAALDRAAQEKETPDAGS